MYAGADTSLSRKATKTSKSSSVVVGSDLPTVSINLADLRPKD
jgi:hypothetical protein